MINFDGENCKQKPKNCKQTAKNEWNRDDEAEARHARCWIVILDSVMVELRAGLCLLTIIMFIMFIVYVYICTHHPNTENDHWQDMKVAQHLNTQVFLAIGAMHKSHLCVQGS